MTQLERAKKSYGYDFGFLAGLGALLVAGLLILTSAAGPRGFQMFGDSYWFVKHQLVTGFLPGALGFLGMFLISPNLWRKNWLLLYIACIVLLGMPFLPGIGNTWGTAHSWIHFAGHSFQTSELVKLLGILSFAGWLDAKRETATQDFKHGFIPFICAIIVPILMLVAQPEVGGMVVIASVALAMYFVAGGRISFILTLLLGGFGAVAALIKAKPYRAERFMVFLHPELDPQGTGYHINQALMSIGSGGLFGLGFGHSRQKWQYLPEVEGDSIFAVISEELGFVSVVAFIGLFLFLVYRLLRIAQRLEYYDRYVVAGYTMWLAAEALINIGSMIGLMPMTGLTLPFVSYGGSSYFALLAGAGIVFRLSSGKGSARK
jgi:cell division protein FtsW